MKKLSKLVAGTAVLVLVAGGAAVAFGGEPRAASHSTQNDVAIAYPDDGVQSSIAGSLGVAYSGAGTSAAQGAPLITDQSAKTMAAVAPAPALPSAASNAGIAAGAPPSVQSSTEASRSSGGAASSPSAATAAGASTDAALSSASIDDRKVVQTASVNLQVKDVGGVFAEVGQIATAAGGFVAGSSFALQGEQQVATATIRIPATRYQDVLGQVRALGVKVEGETSNASDVTQEYSDLDARVRTLQATQAQLLQLLSQTRTIGETLQVQDRLNTTQNQVEQAKGRMLLLDKLSDLATLTIHLRPVVVAPKTETSRSYLGAKVDAAWNDSIDFLGSIAGAVVTVLVFGWWLPFVAIPAFVLLRRTRSHPAPAPVQAYD